MNIRKYQEGDLLKLIPIYKEFFPVHEIFTKSDEEIMIYLEKAKAKGEFLVAEDKGNVVGGLLIVKKQYGSHTLVNFKHIAAKSPVRKIMVVLMQEAEKEVGKAKIELTVAESESVGPAFFKKIGYKVEGKLSSHYRPGELCYILGKMAGAEAQQAPAQTQEAQQ